METRHIAGLTLSFDASEQETADLVHRAMVKSVPLIHETWGLEPPADCRVTIITSPISSVFRSAPPLWWPLLGLSLPLWAKTARQRWDVAGGWAQAYGQRRTVGIKPARLIREASTGIGDHLWIRDGDETLRLERVVCHELTHAFSSHLRLPAWLHEGLAIVSEERYVEQPVVQASTLDTVERFQPKTGPQGYRGLDSLGDEEAVVYLAARGYWLTRYLQDTRPELLAVLLSERHTPADLESSVAAAYDLAPEAFWREIDGLLVAHFLTD